MNENCCGAVLAASLTSLDATNLARGYAALADPIRLRVISILASAPAGEVCVCDLVAPLAQSQPTVSYHLRVLSEAGLVKGERSGKWVWFSLERSSLAALRVAIDS